MKVSVNKSIREEIEITLPAPRFVKFFDSIFYKFFEVEGIIVIQYFTVDVGGDDRFSLNVSPDNFAVGEDAFYLKDNYTEINEQEYNNTLIATLQRFNIIPALAPTIHRQNTEV